MQTKVYSRFGYYPWECPLCREPMLVKQQHRYKVESGSKPVSAAAMAGGNGAAGLRVVGPQAVDRSMPTGEVTELNPAEFTAAVMVESSPMAEFSPKPTESERAVMVEPETKPAEFQLTALVAEDRKPGKTKATRARAAGSNGAGSGRTKTVGTNGAMSRSTRAKKAVSETSEQPPSDQKTA
jgi:hypothetical protein